MRRAPHEGLQAAPLAGESDQLVVAAAATAQPQEAMRQDAALQKGVELVLHELRQVGSGGGFDLGEESRGVLLHQAVQRGLVGAVALVVDRGTIRRPAWLPNDGLHALLTSRRWCLRGLKPSGVPPLPLVLPTVPASGWQPRRGMMAVPPPPREGKPGSHQGDTR